MKFVLKVEIKFLSSFTGSIVTRRHRSDFFNRFRIVRVSTSTDRYGFLIFLIFHGYPIFFERQLKIRRADVRRQPLSSRKMEKSPSTRSTLLGKPPGLGVPRRPRPRLTNRDSLTDLRPSRAHTLGPGAIRKVARNALDVLY